MANISTNALINAVLLTDQGSDPSTPASGKKKLYSKSGGLYIRDSAGNITGPMVAGRVLTLGKGGALTAVAGSMRLYVPWACTIVGVRASVGVAPTGASLIVDVNKNGTTIFTTQDNRPTITATNFTDLSSAPDVTAIAADDYLTVDVDQIGSTVAGSDLILQVLITVP